MTSALKQGRQLKVGDKVDLTGTGAPVPITAMKPRDEFWPMTIAVKVQGRPDWVTLPAEKHYAVS